RSPLALYSHPTQRSFDLSLHHLFHPQLSAFCQIFNFLSLLYPPRFIPLINSNRLGTLSTFPSSSISPSTLTSKSHFQLSFTPLPSTLHHYYQLQQVRDPFNFPFIIYFTLHYQVTHIFS